MPRGLFGKLPQKRDFVSSNVPQSFLMHWEPWLQSGLAASQAELEAHWTGAYRASPIWRFWLGPALCGDAVLGAVMPSWDGIGRCYPLAIIETGHLPAPGVDRQPEWFARVEQLLLATHDPACSYVTVLESLDELPPPRLLPSSPDCDMAASADATDVQPSGVNGLAHEDFDRVWHASQDADVAECSFWWTAGNGRVAPAGFAVRGWPDRGTHTRLLTAAWPTDHAAG
jgi:type VI secretion system protein ImpM